MWSHTRGRDLERMASQFSKWQVKAIRGGGKAYTTTGGHGNYWALKGSSFLDRGEMAPVSDLSIQPACFREDPRKSAMAGNFLKSSWLWRGYCKEIGRWCWTTRGVDNSGRVPHSASLESQLVEYTGCYITQRWPYLDLYHCR